MTKEDDGLKNIENKQLPPLKNYSLDQLITAMQNLTESNLRLSQAIESLVVINHEILEACLEAYAPTNESSMGQTLDG